MPIAPGAALRNIRAFKADIACTELCLDKSGNRAAFHKFRHNKAGHTERRSNIQHIAFGTGCLEIKIVAVVDCHPVFRCDAYTHAGDACFGILVVFSDFYAHDNPSVSFFLIFLVLFGFCNYCIKKIRKKILR